MYFYIKLSLIMKTIEVKSKGLKRTTYSLDWNVVIGLESRLLRDFQNEKSESKGRELLMVSIGVRLGLRVVDNLSLKWCDLMDLKVGEKFIRTEKKTNKERILVMSSKLKEVLDIVVSVLKPNPEHFIFSSQKEKVMNRCVFKLSIGC